MQLKFGLFFRSPISPPLGPHSFHHRLLQETVIRSLIFDAATANALTNDGCATVTQTARTLQMRLMTHAPKVSEVAA